MLHQFNIQLLISAQVMISGCGIETCVGLRAQGGVCLKDSSSPSVLPHPPTAYELTLVRVLSLSLSLSQKINLFLKNLPDAPPNIRIS